MLKTGDPRRRSSRHDAKQEVKGYDLFFGRPYQTKQEEAETTRVRRSTNPKDSGTMISLVELVRPNKQGKRSARTRDKNPTPWSPLEKLVAMLLLNSKEEITKHGGDDHSASLKKRKSTEGGSMPCSASDKVPKLMENSRDQYASIELPVIEADIAGPGLAVPTNRGRRSIRGKNLAAWRSLGLTMLMNNSREFTNAEHPAVESGMSGRRSVRLRGKKPTSYASLYKFYGSEVEIIRRCKNGQKLCSEKAKLTCGGATSSHASKMPAKVKNTSFHLSQKTNVQMDDSSAEDDGAGTNAAEQTGVPVPDTLLEAQDSNHADTNVVDQMDALMTDAIDELGADADFVAQDCVSMADTLADANGGNGSVANALVHAAVQKSQQGMESDAVFGPEIFSALNLDAGAGYFDMSNAESCLASLYGQSERDSCIDFAVKILMGETPLGKEAAEVEGFFNQKIISERITIAGLSSFRKAVQASLQGTRQQNYFHEVTSSQLDFCN